MRNLRTPLSHAKGNGSAKDGTTHFWHQRLTALALIPMVIWFCFSLASLAAMDYTSITSWLSSPVSAVLMICALIAVFFHASMGIQAVLEDYVSNHATRTGAIVLVQLLCALLGVTGVFSVLKIAIGS